MKRTYLSAAPIATNSIHGIGDLLGRVSSQVLRDRIAEQLAPRFLRAPGQPLRSFENVIRN
jgi:hypothetical protein